MHKEGSKTYNDLIKIFILLLCTSIRQDKEIGIIYMYVTMQPIQPIKLHFPLKFPLFLANVNVLTNKLVIFTILFLQCCNYFFIPEFYFPCIFNFNIAIAPQKINYINLTLVTNFYLI